jgi:hypothetical protein
VSRPGQVAALVRCALLAKLAGDLGDPALTRRAAREAAGRATP